MHLCSSTSCSLKPTNGGLAEVLGGHILGQVGAHQHGHVDVQQLVDDVCYQLDAPLSRVNALCRGRRSQGHSRANGYVSRTKLQQIPVNSVISKLKYSVISSNLVIIISNPHAVTATSSNLQ